MLVKLKFRNYLDAAFMAMVINAFYNKRYGPGCNSQRLHSAFATARLAKINYGGDQLSTFAKKNDFARLRNCRFVSNHEHPFNIVNANDNFANDNFEFAPVAVAA